MSTEVYVASLMAKRFAGFPEKSGPSLSDVVRLKKVNDFTLSGQEQIKKTFVMDVKWSTFQNHGGIIIPIWLTPRSAPVETIQLTPATLDKSGELSVPIGGSESFVSLSSIKSKLKRYLNYVYQAVLTIVTTAYLCVRENPKPVNRWKSKSAITVKKKQSSYQSTKYPKVTSSHVLNAYADLTRLCRATVLQTLERIKQKTNYLLYKSKVFEKYDHVLQRLGESVLLNNNSTSDIPILWQGATENNLCQESESDILSASNRRTTSERANFSNTQANQSISLNQSATSRERSIMDQIIADELAALAAEVGDVFDRPLGGEENEYFNEMNANLLREDAIDLPNLDDLEDSDFDPYEAEGGEYEEDETRSSYGRSPLPQMSPSPYEDHLRFLDEAHARCFAEFDDQMMLNHNNFPESDDEFDAPHDPKRPRLSGPADYDPKTPPN